MVNIELGDWDTIMFVFIFLQDNSDKPIKRENPHKYLLYKPTFGQFYAFLSAGFKVSSFLHNLMIICVKQSDHFGVYTLSYFTYSLPTSEQ